MEFKRSENIIKRWFFILVWKWNWSTCNDISLYRWIFMNIDSITDSITDRRQRWKNMVHFMKQVKDDNIHISVWKFFLKYFSLNQSVNQYCRFMERSSFAKLILNIEAKLSSFIESADNTREAQNRKETETTILIRESRKLPAGESSNHAVRKKLKRGRVHCRK